MQSITDAKARPLGQVLGPKKGPGRGRALRWFSWWCEFYFTARPNCAAWSEGIVNGLVAPSTSAHGPFTEFAACSVPSKVTVTDPSIEAKVREAFNPALYNKSKERVENSHYFVKDFNPLKLGSLRLKKGRGLLRLTAPKIVGKQAIDVHSIELVKLP